VAFKALQTIEETYLLDCKIAASFFDLEDSEKGMFYLRKALNKDKQSTVFFLDYYPEAKQNDIIMNLIHQFQ